MAMQPGILDPQMKVLGDNVGPSRTQVITLLDDNKQYFTVVADHSKMLNSASAVGLKIPLEGNVATQTVVTTRRPYIIEDSANNPVNPLVVREEFRRIGINYTAIFPIIINDVVIGTLGVDMVEKDAFLDKNQIALARRLPSSRWYISLRQNSHTANAPSSHRFNMRQRIRCCSQN